MVSALGFLTLEVDIEGLLEILISGLVKVIGDGAFWKVLGFLCWLPVETLQSIFYMPICLANPSFVCPPLMLLGSQTSLKDS